MRKLYIYTGVTPNQDNGRHFMFTDVSLYMAELQPHLLTSIILDNHRINSNVARLALSSLLTEENYDTVTYLIDYDEETKYFRCYNVLRATLDSNVNYILEVDLWATFIKDCDFSKVHITRCNRQLNKYGIYDDPQSTSGRFYTVPQHSNPATWLNPQDDHYAKYENLWLVFLLQYNTYQKKFGDDLITQTGLFAINLGAIKTGIIDLNPQNFTDVTPLDLAVSLIGGIYGVAGTSGTLDAQVLQAWVLPDVLLQLTYKGSQWTQQVKLFERHAGIGDTTLDVNYIYPSKKYIEFNTVEVDINKIVYFGTINNGLKLKKFTTDDNYADVFVQAFIGDTTLKIVVMQGEEEKDLTSDFAITLTSSASITTSIREFARTFTTALGAGKSFMQSAGKGDYAGAGLGLAGNIAGMVDMTANTNKAIGNGDATTIYWRSDATLPSYALNPFVTTEFASTQDVNLHTNMLGATFDYYGATGDALTVFDFEDKTMLGSGSIEDTYIVASCDIDGIPLEAHNEIGRKLTAGIYYKLLTA